MTDEAGCQLDQRLVVLRPPFGPYPDLPVPLEPRQGSLDVPACLAEAGTMLCPTLGELRLDPSLAKLIAVRFGVITLIPLHDVGSLPGSAFFFPEPSAPRPRAG